MEGYKFMNKGSKIGMVVVLCFCILGTIYAQEPTDDLLVHAPVNAGDVVCTMEVMMCPDGTAVSRRPELNCEFAPCPEHIADSIEVDRELCEQEILEINSMVKEITERYEAQLKPLLADYNTKHSLYLKAREDFLRCLNQKVASKITANMMVSAIGNSSKAQATKNMIEERLAIDSKAGAIPSTSSVASDILSVDPDALSRSIIAIPETVSESCNDERAKAKLAYTELSLEIAKIRELKQSNSPDLEQIGTLNERKQELLKVCGETQNIANTKNKDCAVPDKLITEEQRLVKEMTTIQEEYLKASDSREINNEFLTKYQEAKEQHILILEKIDSINKHCEIPQLDLCQDQEIITAIEDLKKQLLAETDKAKIYELKAKLDNYYLKQKICGSGATGRETKTSAYKTQISDLQGDIIETDKAITAVKPSIEEFKVEYKNAGQERKAEVLASNSERLFIHTREILDKRIAELKEKILRIESEQSIATEQKQSIIDGLTKRIAELELNKSNLELAMTPDDVKKSINEARKTETKAIAQNKRATLYESTHKLGSIIKKHFPSNVELNEKAKQLTEKVDTLTEQSSISEINNVIEEYRKLKSELNK